MKTSFFSICLSVMGAIGTFAHAQSLQPAWEYTYDETEAGKQITGTIMNSGSDGSVALVAIRTDGGGSPPQNQIFWLRANDDGSSPTAPLWVSGWAASSNTNVVSVRKNHLVYTSGRELRSVTINASGVATESTVKTFSGTGPLEFTVELPRAPGFVYATAIDDDNEGFKFSAFHFTPAAPSVSEVAAISSVSGNSLSISFRSELGINYQLQSSATLEATTWQNVGGVIAGNGAIQTFNQPIVVPKLFFRIVAL